MHIASAFFLGGSQAFHLRVPLLAPVVVLPNFRPDRAAELAPMASALLDGRHDEMGWKEGLQLGIEIAWHLDIVPAEAVVTLHAATAGLKAALAAGAFASTAPNLAAGA